MFIPFNVDVPMERIPWANWALIALTVAVSMIILVERPEDLMADLILWRGRGFLSERLVGYLFVHAGIVHLAGNMVFLFCFGNAINAKFGQVTYILFYALAGGLAGLVWLMVGEGTSLVGASGAIMGVTGAFLVLYPRNDVSVFYVWFTGAGTFSTSSFVVIVIYLGFDIAGLLLSEHSAVAYVAHVVGAAFGIAIAVVFLSIGYIKSTRYEQNLLQILKGEDR